MKLISVKIHTYIVMVVPNDYDTNHPNSVEAIAEDIKQDLVDIFDDKMVTVKEIKTIQDIPPDYLNVEPWLASDLDYVDEVECGTLTCKQLLESRLHNTE